MTIECAQKNLCNGEFWLYIPRSPHRRVRVLLRDLSGFFVAQTTRFLAALCFLENAHD
jgi:hypothetical protein